MNRAIHPGYAKLNDTPKELAQTHLSKVALIALLVVPIAISFASVSDLLVPILLGEKWIDAIPILKVLAITGALSAVTSNAYYIFTALGSPKTDAYLNAIQVVIFLPLIIGLTANSGLQKAALAFAISPVIGTPLVLFVAARYLNISSLDYCLHLYRPIVGGAVIFFGVQCCLGIAEQGSIMALFIAIAIGAALYVGTVHLLVNALRGKTSVETEVLRTIAPFVKKLAGVQDVS